MQIFVDIFLIFILYFLFGYTHTFLSSKKIKNFIKDKFGNLIAFYRLSFNIISILLLALILKYAPRPDIIIYDLQNPYDLLILIPQFLGLIGFFWSFKYLCASELIGIGQIKRWLRNEYDVEDLDERTTLNIRGPFKFVRHPIYFFSILFLISKPTMDLFYLITFICAVIYFYVGSIYEEKKLVDEYGKLYTQYQSNVPRILPLKIFKPYKIEKTL